MRGPAPMRRLRQRPLLRNLLGHNIGRMTITGDRRHVLIPHQLLDAKAETTRGGVHWGGVMLIVAGLSLGLEVFESGAARWLEEESR